MARIETAGVPAMPETAGSRLYAIRLACGDGVRTPEPLARFALRVKRKTKKAYSPMTLSLLERMEQKWKLEDAETLALVDPLKRGEGWLGFGMPPESRPEDDSGEDASRSVKG